MDKTYILLKLMLIGLLFNSVTSCKPNSENGTSENDAADSVIARVGDRSITRERLQTETDKAQGRVPPETVLERLIKKEAQLYRAESEGIRDDPEVQKRIQAILIGELKRRSLEPRLRSIEISEEEIEKGYDERKKHFHQPEVRRLAIIHALDSDGRARERVLAAIANANQLSADKGFAQFALEASNDSRSRYRGGDVGWVKRDQFPGNVPAILVEEGFSLAAPGDVADAVRLDDGWGTVRLMATRPETVQPLNDPVKAQLKSLLLQEKREAVMRLFDEETLALAEVEIIRPDWSEAIDHSINAEKPAQPPSLP